MLRIDVSTGQNQEAIISLSGDFTGEYIPCVEAAINGVSSELLPILLNLRHVTLVDRESMSFLRTLCETKVTMKNCPGYLERWIDQECRGCPELDK
jgi:hypothetical protein